MSQSRKGSLLEAVANIAVGFGIAMLTTHIVMPWFGHHLTLSDNFWITAIFTVVSLVRSYTLRRVFNRMKGL